MKATRRAPELRTAILLGLCALLPGIALAEGAVRLLNCEVSQTCTAQGQCSDDSGSVSFRLEPLKLDSLGAGQYRLLYEGADVDMQAGSEAGPFVWARDEERHALLASSETLFLWHRLKLADGPTAEIHFLSCVEIR